MIDSAKATFELAKVRLIANTPGFFTDENFDVEVYYQAILLDKKETKTKKIINIVLMGSSVVITFVISYKYIFSVIGQFF